MKDKRYFVTFVRYQNTEQDAESFQQNPTFRTMIADILSKSPLLKIEQCLLHVL